MGRFFDRRLAAVHHRRDRGLRADRRPEDRGEQPQRLGVAERCQQLDYSRPILRLHRRLSEQEYRTLGEILRNAVEDGQIDDSDFSYTLRLAYDVNDTINVYASYSEGFREPSLYELYSTPTSSLFPVEDPRDGSFESEQPITLRGVVRSNATFSGGTFHSAMAQMPRAKQMRDAMMARRKKEPRPEGRKAQEELGLYLGGLDSEASKFDEKLAARKARMAARGIPVRT